MLQEYKRQQKDLLVQDDFEISLIDWKNIKKRITEPGLPLSDAISHSRLWCNYVTNLSRVLCSFLLGPEDNKSDPSQVTTGRMAAPVTSSYSELSVKWMMRVLLTVFPCIKACSNENDLPNHLR